MTTPQIIKERGAWRLKANEERVHELRRDLEQLKQELDQLQKITSSTVRKGQASRATPLHSLEHRYYPSSYAIISK